MRCKSRNKSVFCALQTTLLTHATVMDGLPQSAETTMTRFREGMRLEIKKKQTTNI